MPQTRAAVAGPKRAPRWLLAIGFVCLAVSAAAGCAVSPFAAPPPLTGAQFNERCETEECGEGLTCRFAGQPGALERRCALEPGRCRDSHDCAPSSQRCMRLNERLGVCQDAGI
ncbi:MAG: hypothetical protein ABW217_16540 [Polyangiaceae bacterium]